MPGISQHPLYYTWANMIQRCENPKTPSFRWYGGRNIRVCPEWHSSAVFISWIEENLGPKPSRCTLDRYPDNDGDYKPGNVRWATWRQQRRDRESAVIGVKELKLRLPDDLHTRLTGMAAAESRSLNSMMIVAIRFALDGMEVRERPAGEVPSAGTSTIRSRPGTGLTREGA